MFCKYCGKEIDDDAIFCKYCGKRLKSSPDSDAPVSGSEVNFTMASGTQPQDSEEAEANPEAETPVNSTQQDEKGDKEMYTLKIVREKQAFAVNPAVKVKIDGEREFSLENDATLSIPVEPGEHVIYFSSGLRNKTVKKNITSDIVLSMKWNRVTGGMEIV